MYCLVDLIENDTIGLVAAQNVDWFCRDLTQIQSAFSLTPSCATTCVMASSIVYDFAYPTMGAYNMKLFRDDAQYTADCLE